MSKTRIESWVPSINKAKAVIALKDPEVNKIDNSLVCAFLEHESKGDVNAYIPSEDQLSGGSKFQVGAITTSKTKNVSRRWLENTDTKKGGVKLIMGGFQGSANWWNYKPRAFFGASNLSGLDYVRRIRDNRQTQVEDFLASILYLKKSHHFRPDLIAINHSRDGSGRTSQKIVKMLTPEQQQQLKSGQQITGDVSNISDFAQNWQQKSRNNAKILYPYAKGIMQSHIKWAGILGEPDPTSQYILQWTNRQFKRSPSKSIFAKIVDAFVQKPESKSRSGDENMPFHSGSFILPEELRKGIIPQFMSIDEWYLAQLAESESKKVSSGKDKGSVDNSFFENNSPIGEDDKNYQTVKSIRADEDITERRRYVQSIVEAEYYRRRFAPRSTPPVAGPFNPSPVAGLPGLILTPDRPIIAKVNSVTHVINVEGGSGTTTCSFTSPRYWDEGEVWYYMGGKSTNGQLSRQFPQWHNSLVVPTNNTEKKSDLDIFYEFMVGVTSIPYESNHTHKDVNDSIVTSLLKDRNTQGFEISAETLEIKEYNVKIAQTDEEGYFAEDTLARRFYGKVKPSSNNRPKVGVREQNLYTERYGVRERELLEGFLGNKITQTNEGYTVVYGPTFNNIVLEDGKRHLNQIQKGVIEYMKELETRMLDGGA